jgi:hypothetical protein
MFGSVISLGARPNNGMQRTRIQRAFYHQCFVRAADAGREAATDA